MRPRLQPFEPSMAAALKESLTEEFRTGFVLPDPSLSEVEESSLRGWNTWLQYTNASSVGFPAGDKFILIRHITIEVGYTTEPDCEEYARAARALIDDHKVSNCPAFRSCMSLAAAVAAADRSLLPPLFLPQIQVAIITHNNCKTRLSQMYHEAGILHFIQSGTPMTLPDGSLYLNAHSW